MKVIEYFSAPDRAHWLSEIGRADWSAASFLASLLQEDRLMDTLGETAMVLMLTEGDRLVSFCTLAPLDEVQPTVLGPWIGFVYTFPEFRGRRCAGLLLDHAESLAAAAGHEAVYISTDHNGLYERYGYIFFDTARTVYGENSRVYRKLLRTNGAEKEQQSTP